MLQAPVFHGHAFSLNVQFEEPTAVSDVALALAGEHVAVVGDSEEAPNNVNAAGQGDILVSVSSDSADARSVWLLATSDNFRLAAITAARDAPGRSAHPPR